MRGLLARLAAERERWPLWLPVAFAAGIGGYFALPWEPPFWLGASLSMSALLSWRLWHRHGPDRLKGGALLALALLAGSLGFAAAQLRTAAVAAPALVEEIGPTRVTGRVIEIERLAAGERVVLDRLSIAGLAPDRVPSRVRVTLRGNQPAFWPGDWLMLRGSLRGPPPPSAPGAFDFQRYSYFQRIGGVGFAFGKAEVVGHAPAYGLEAAETWLARVRHAITGRILAALPARPGAVAAALMTGERRTIPERDLEAMRDAGLAHLLAISGLHIGLVAGILFTGLRAVFALLPPLALKWPIKKYAAAAALAGAAGYSLIAGATVPTQRALIAAAIVLLAVMLDRRGISLRSVAWAALAILAVHPEALLGASFQMSFAAATALVAGYEAIAERRRGRVGEPLLARLGWLRLPMLYVGGVMLTTVIAGLATGPFSLHHFNRVADYGVAANLAAVPLAALWVMPWAVAAFALMPLGLEAWALAPMGWGIEGVLTVAETVAGWPGAVTLLPAGPDWALPAAALGGLWLCLWKGQWRHLGLAGVAAALLATILARPPDVLVDGEARLLAVRDGAGGYVVSDLRRAKFERDVWLRRAGLAAPSNRWPEGAVTGADGRLRCDAAGCVYRANGLSVALAASEDALIDDCWRADAVVSLVPIRGDCPAPAGTVDRFDLWLEGAHALWLSDDGIRIESVASRRGERPWVIRRGQQE